MPSLFLQLMLSSSLVLQVAHDLLNIPPGSLVYSFVYSLHNATNINTHGTPLAGKGSSYY